MVYKNRDGQVQWKWQDNVPKDMEQQIPVNTEIWSTEIKLKQCCKFQYLGNKTTAGTKSREGQNI